MSKSNKARELGKERASNRISRYLEKLRWRNHQIDEFNVKVFNPTNKRNTKAYFEELAQFYEQMFRITLEKFLETHETWSSEYRVLWEQLTQIYKEPVEEIEEDLYSEQE